MSTMSIWKEDSLKIPVRDIKNSIYNDRFFIEVNPNPSAYFFNKKIIFFPKTYYMNLKREEISNNNVELLNNKNSVFLKYFLRKNNIVKMRVSLKDSASYHTIESIPETIIKETILLSQTLIIPFNRKEYYAFDKGVYYISNKKEKLTKKQLYYLMLIKLKFKRDNYHNNIATHYLNFVKKCGFRTANSKLSIFSILNRIIRNNKNHELVLSEIFKEKIRPYEIVELKEEFHNDYYLSEKDFHNLNFPYYDYSESLLKFVFLDEDNNHNQNNQSLFSLESFLSDDKNLYYTPLSVFYNLKNNDVLTAYTEILPKISKHFKQHAAFFSSNDFFSTCTINGSVQLNEYSSYDITALIYKEIKSIEKSMIELSQWNNLVNNNYFISQFIKNSFFYKKFSYNYNTNKQYYNDYVTPIMIFKITLLSTLIKMMNDKLSSHVDKDIIQSIHYDNRLFEDMTVDNIASIAEKYIEVNGDVNFNHIKNILF